MGAPGGRSGERQDSGDGSGEHAADRWSERALAAWREHDLTHALHATDRDAVRATDAPRALVLEHLAHPLASRDLFNACARLGHLLAEAGASPSLAAATLDGAVHALRDRALDESRAAARASLTEGYVSGVVDAERASARATWEYPTCAVQVRKDVMAIAAGFPTADADALAEWAARVALAVSRAGCRFAVLAGDAVARAELTQALALVGVTVRTSAEPSSWLASLFRRGAREERA
jgi:hypothetical protein